MMAYILIVDDHESIADAVRVQLKSAGYNVDVVSDSSLLERQVTRETYDLALVDMILQKEVRSGIDVLEILSRFSPATKLVLYTAGGEGRRHHISTALSKFDVVGGVPKDVKTSALLECVQTVLQGGTYFDPEIAIYRPSKRNPADAIMQNPVHAAIWMALAHGHRSIKSIAKNTCYSVSTIRKATGPMGEVLRDLGLISATRTTLADLAAYAAEHYEFIVNWEWRHRRDAASRSSEPL